MSEHDIDGSDLEFLASAGQGRIPLPLNSSEVWMQNSHSNAPTLSDQYQSHMATIGSSTGTQNGGHNTPNHVQHDQQQSLPPSFKQELVLVPLPEPEPTDWSYIGYSDTEDTINEPPSPIAPKRRMRQFERIDPAVFASPEDSFTQSPSTLGTSVDLPIIAATKTVQKLCEKAKIGREMWRKMVEASTCYMGDEIKGEMVMSGARVPELLNLWMEVMDDALDLDEYKLLKGLAENKRQQLFGAITKEARKPLKAYYHKGKRLQKDVGEVTEHTWSERNRTSRLLSSTGSTLAPGTSSAPPIIGKRTRAEEEEEE